MSRLDLLCDELAKAGFAAVALVPGANLRYLTGLDIHMNERIAVLLVAADGRAAMALPKLETPRAAAQARIPIQFHPWQDEEGPAGAVRAAVAELGLSDRLGVEYTAMRVLELRALEAAAPGVQVGDSTDTLAQLRMRKDADELAAMRQAVAIVEQSLQAAIDQIRVGMTERQLGEIWDREMAARGSSPSFTTIIASGPNAANPHHSNTDRAFQAGDLIIMDGGSWYEGYASDITRTVAVGEPGPEARRIYEVVKLANQVGRRACRPGISGAAIDQAARDVIEDSGYGQYFIHRTGHGLGLEIHEPPYIVGGADAPLPLGATFTIEPGVYIAGVTGVRIEDNVVLTKDGAESLTNFPRDLIIVKV